VEGKTLTQWYEQAACRGQDINLFFDQNDRTKRRNDTEALAFCNGTDKQSACLVREECLEFALSFSQEYDMYGIYGGLTGAQRRRLRRGDLRPYKQRGPARQIITGLDDAPPD
jgi:hypothetical protein